MPELPDVELYQRYLDQHALRQTIEHVAVNDARILGELSARAFVARLTGNRFEETRRHGKHLLVRLQRDGWLTLHFGMTGRLVYFKDVADDPPYDRVRFDFKSGGHLAYVNRRMLGRVGLADAAMNSSTPRNSVPMPSTRRSTWPHSRRRSKAAGATSNRCSWTRR
jgi:formamidopyrimidine-DNA glycosylase